MPAAIISDIHANMEALESVLEDIDRRGVETIYCLGDLVDYGAEPVAAIERIRERGIFTLKGNHDHYIDAGLNPMHGYSVGVMASNAWTKEQLEPHPSLTEWLGSNEPSARVTIDGHDILLVHGSPGNPLYGYISVDPSDRGSSIHYEDDVLDMQFCAPIADGAEGFYCGHIHVPFSKKLPLGRFAVNVGSVGQPRDEDNRACYCVTDGTFEGTELVRVPYDIEKTQAKIRAAGLPENNARRLQDGW